MLGFGHGYSKMTLNGVTNEGLYEWNVFIKNTEDVKEYDPTTEFSA